MSRPRPAERAAAAIAAGENHAFSPAAGAEASQPPRQTIGRAIHTEVATNPLVTKYLKEGKS